jgi:signal transduction histidine kinase
MLPMNRSLALLLICGFLFAAAQAIAVEPPGELLTNASDVLSLSAAQASRHIKISIKGVVTAAETNWNGKFFVQDSTAGVFVNNLSSSDGHMPVPGDVVEVSGVSRPGSYAPVVSLPQWKKVGTAPLPKARPVTIEQLISGAEDGQRIEISGVVRNVRISGSNLAVELVSGGYRIRAYLPIPSDTNIQALVGTMVRMKGTAAVSFNRALRHFITVSIFVPLPADFIIEEPVKIDPFKEPLIPLNGIAQYRKGRSFNDQVHVKGVVTYEKAGKGLFLQDATGGLQVKSSQAMPFSLGDVVEAVGFPGVENYLPVLDDASFKITSEPRTNITSKAVTGEDLLAGLHHADFITLKGILLDRLIRGGLSPIDGSNAIKNILVLQNSNLMFTAEEDGTGQSPFLASIPIGSMVEASGICFLESEEDGKIKSVQVLLPNSNYVRILSKPDWLTPQHLLVILTIVFPVLIVAVSWTITVSKKNSALRYLIHERELDQNELQKAHDTLEWRVKERTEQLKFQITARKEAEFQFKGTLAERTRLAQELHDTLEQTLTGITLQLDTVAKLSRSNPDVASRHLGLVRNLMRQSQIDLRRSIWDLRSRELEEFNLSNALSASGCQLGDGAGVKVKVETIGRVRPLPEVVEENLLRIGQEALTNIVKHSSATLAEIKLEFGAQTVVLEIKDNGKGFTPENCVGPNDGHFGLLGMKERARRFGGQLSLTSAPGNGTTIHVEIPIAQNSDRPDSTNGEAEINFE